MIGRALVRGELGDPLRGQPIGRSRHRHGADHRVVGVVDRSGDGVQPGLVFLRRPGVAVGGDLSQLRRQCAQRAAGQAGLGGKFGGQRVRAFGRSEPRSLTDDMIEPDAARPDIAAALRDSAELHPREMALDLAKDTAVCGGQLHDDAGCAGTGRAVRHATGTPTGGASERLASS